MNKKHLSQHSNLTPHPSPLTPIRIIINGINGKMGQATFNAIANEPDLTLVGSTTKNDDLVSIIKKHKADVVIDFTTPTSVFENTLKIIEADARPVIGTSGLSVLQIDELSELCKAKNRGAIIAPNFSIGGILMMKYAEDAAKYFSDVEIIESHHPAKVDAPSGTAKKTAELIAKHKKQKNTSAKIDATLKTSRAIHHYEIPIHALRLTGVFANQQVIFGSEGETFTLQHNALNRSSMMPGVFLCCRKVMELNHLVYGMETLI